MFDHLRFAINIDPESTRAYIVNPVAFTRKRKFSLYDFCTNIIFNQRKTLRNNIDTHLKYSVNPFESYTKQSFSQQRLNIDPAIFKEINLRYLKEIGYLNSKFNNPFFITFYGFRIYAFDGSRFDLINKEKTLNEFNFPEGYKKTPKVVFCAITDVLNNFMLDGILGQRGIGEMTLVHQNLKNCQPFINPETSIFVGDRGFVSLELICRLINMKTNFVIHLKKDSYTDERKDIISNDSPIDINITKNRLKLFKDEELKEIFQDQECLNLRIVTIELNSNKTEWLLTNLDEETMSYEQINEIYDARWGIECTYKTLKQRLQIENYTAQSKIGIKQDIYSTFITYNIFAYSRIFLNLIINRVMRRKGNKGYYEVEQSNLISRLKIDLFEVIVNPNKEKIRIFVKNLIEKCTKSPNKARPPRKYERNKKTSTLKNRDNYKNCF